MAQKKEFELDEERAKKAYETLLKYLGPSPRSEKECKEKLYEKGFHKDEVEYALERAKSYRYIDDEEYVRTFLSYYGDRLGKKKLAYKLTQEKGIDKSLVENLIEDVISEERELEKCRTEAEKYVRQKKITDKSGASKVYAHLMQKGYDGATVSKVMATLFDIFEE